MNQYVQIGSKLFCVAGRVLRGAGWPTLFATRNAQPVTRRPFNPHIILGKIIVTQLYRCNGSGFTISMVCTD